jgi:hypothetical protein
MNMNTTDNPKKGKQADPFTTKKGTNPKETKTSISLHNGHPECTLKLY